MIVVMPRILCPFFCPVVAVSLCRSACDVTGNDDVSLSPASCKSLHGIIVSYTTLIHVIRHYHGKHPNSSE